MTGVLRAYRGLTRLALPLVWRIEKRKLSRANVAPVRQNEKLGHASQPRPDGPLIWLHGASVGESLSVLSLIDTMAAMRPDVNFLLTSGTSTSASLIATRLPARTIHQFAPLDSPDVVERFLKHWKPNAVLFVESELWPNMLTQAHQFGARLALVNARLSEASVNGWKKYPKTALALLDRFEVFLTQNPKMRQNLIDMGAPANRVRTGFNLKSQSAPLPIDANSLAELRKTLGSRPVWIASSTHPGEEKIILTAHKALLAMHPDLCLILAPRHPERGSEVARLIEDEGWATPQRSTGALPDGPVYLADTLGELGTLYALSDIVFLGGSLSELGGHNPYEVANSGAAVLTGPHVFNFEETFEPLLSSGGAVIVRDAKELSTHVSRWLDDRAALDQAKSAAERVLTVSKGRLEGMAQSLLDVLEVPHA